MVRSAAVGTFSFRQIFVVHGGLQMDPIVTVQDINGVHRPCKTMAKIPRISKDYHSWTWLGWLLPDITGQKHQQFVERNQINFWRRSSKMSTRLWVLSCLALGEPSLQLTTFYSQTNPPFVNKWLSTLRHPAQAPRCSHQEPCIDGVPSRAGPMRSRSCFCLNSYRSCDACIIVKTLPFAECTVSDYTCLSQACSEQRKGLTSIAFVPCYFFAGTHRNDRKWWPVRQQARLGNIFRPWRGHIYSRKATKIDKDEGNFHCWAPNGAPKGTHALQKKGVARDSSLRWLAKIF